MITPKICQMGGCKFILTSIFKHLARWFAKLFSFFWGCSKSQDLPLLSYKTRHCTSRHSWALWGISTDCIIHQANNWKNVRCGDGKNWSQSTACPQILSGRWFQPHWCWAPPWQMWSDSQCNAVKAKFLRRWRVSTYVCWFRSKQQPQQTAIKPIFLF